MITVSPRGLLAQISLVHLVSHLHIMALPALLPVLRDALDVGFVELGVAIAVFNVVSALVQAPLGFLVDRWGARRMLRAALLLGAASFGALAIFPDYHLLLVAMVTAGIANGVYHPADYSLLSRGIPARNMGRAFSIHTFAGFLGAALAPPLLLGSALWLTPRWAFAIAALAGVIGCLVLMIGQHPPHWSAPATPRAARTGTLAGTQIGTLVVLTLLFMLLSLSTGALDKFSVPALEQGFQVPLSTGNLALTAFLFASALGVLLGGVLADRTRHHGRLAAIAFALAALTVALVATVSLPGWALITAWAATGLLSGVVAPSRDMLVRAASAPGAEGRTFGIVSTGFNLGGVLGPLLFGWLLDHGQAPMVLWASVGFMVLTTLVVLAQERRPAKAVPSMG